MIIKEIGAIIMAQTSDQSKVTTWMREVEKDCIARGWTRAEYTGPRPSAIISPNLCKKYKSSLEKTQEQK